MVRAWAEAGLAWSWRWQAEQLFPALHAPGMMSGVMDNTEFTTCGADEPYLRAE
jgi:hypothetical protein